jgi:hypothetical protein
LNDPVLIRVLAVREVHAIEPLLGHLDKENTNLQVGGLSGGDQAIRRQTSALFRPIDRHLRNSCP